MKVIIIDEAYHVAASSYRHVLSRFNSSIKNPRTARGSEDQVLNSAVAPKHSVPTAGFSATFSRRDCLALGSAFDWIVYQRLFGHHQ